MRKWLLLALLLYNIITLASRYDYEERRPWRKMEMDRKPTVEWEERRRRDYDSPRYPEEEPKGFVDHSRDPDKLTMTAQREKSVEMDHMNYQEKEPEKKVIPLSCDRPHERYESCFAGCASVTCDNPHDRLRPCYPFCEQGCVCVAPYVRDDRTHKCVLPEECTRGLKGIPDLGDET